MSIQYRIIHLISSACMGGAETTLLNLLPLLSREFSVELICLNQPHPLWAEALTEKKIKWRVVPAGVKFWRFLSQQKKNPAKIILHTHGYKADAYGFLVKLFFSLPVVSTVHGWTEASWRLRLYKQLDLLFLQIFNRVLVVSPEIRNFLISRGFKEAQVDLVYNGIEPAKFAALQVPDSLRQIYSKDGQRLFLGTIGRLSAEKGQAVFLRLAQRVANKYPNAHFLVIGEGPQRPYLESQAREAGLLPAKITFTGQISPQELGDYLALLDIVVLTSEREGLPLVVLEAMAAGKCVVSFLRGAIPEVIDSGKDGFLVSPGNEDELYQIIIQLLTDAELRKKVGMAAQEKIRQHFSLSRLVEKIKTIYQGAAG